MLLTISNKYKVAPPEPPSSIPTGSLFKLEEGRGQSASDDIWLLASSSCNEGLFFFLRREDHRFSTVGYLLVSLA